MAKVSKPDANYRKGTKAQNCGNCYYMHQDGTCTKVQGIVTRTMTSDYWRKQNESRKQA